MAKTADFEVLFNLSPDLLCVAGVDGYFKQINPAFLDVLGYPEEALLSKPFIDLIHPDDVEPTLAEIESLRTGNKTLRFKNRYLHREGHYIWLSWSAQADIDIGKIYAVARDVTIEQNMRHELRQLHEALKKQTIFAKTDRAGVITEVNEQFCQISGYSADELIGNTHRVINSGAHPKEFFDDLWRTIASGQSWSGLIQNRTKNGDAYFVHSVIMPVSSADGKIESYLSVRFDFTQQINAINERDRVLAILNETGKIAKVGGWELDVSSGNLLWTDETFKILEVEKKDDQRPILPEGLELFTPSSKPIIEQDVCFVGLYQWQGEL